MLRKRQLKKKGVTQVTFTLSADILSAEVAGDAAYVLGEFNEWQPTQAMKRQKDGSWKATVELEPGRTYAFRYRVGDQMWLNDPEADGYAPNPYGEENSVVTT